MAGIDEDPNCHRHCSGVDEVVEHYRNAEMAVFAHIGVPILKDHHGGGRGWVVLLWDIHPVLAACVGEDRADVCVVRQVALWHIGMALRVRPMLVAGWWCHAL